MHDSLERQVMIAAEHVALEGTLHVPSAAQGLVVFAHGSGSSRHSPRNRFVAEQLHTAGLATLLFDLLTADEEVLDRRTAELRFNIDLLAGRLLGATQWLQQQPDVQSLRIGYFGSSTGAAAALIAAARHPHRVGAVVSRGGRPDLAGAALEAVRVPTLLIVGGSDDVVLALNRQALQHLHALKQLAIIPGATHLFEEPGALTSVAHIAARWFRQHLAVPSELPGAEPG